MHQAGNVAAFLMHICTACVKVYASVLHTCTPCFSRFGRKFLKENVTLADSSGSKINDQDFLSSLKDGDEMTLSWTLFNYMKISGAVFPSHVRLYCFMASLMASACICV